MARRIEDYALIGNCESAALVGRDGSIDWLAMPRFDSAACFAALLGEPQHGRWLIAPLDSGARSVRRYRGNTLILETDFETADGRVRIIDFMAGEGGEAHVVRVVRGLKGRVAMRCGVCRGRCCRAIWSSDSTTAPSCPGCPDRPTVGASSSRVPSG